MMATIAIGLLVLIASLILVADSQRSTIGTGGITWVRWGIGIRGIAVFGLAMTIYIFIDGVLSGRPVVAAVVALLFGSLAIPLFAIGFFWAIGYGQDGLYCMSPWRRSRRVPWNDVLSVSFSVPMRQWIISTKQQGMIRVNELALGCSALISEMNIRGVPVEPRPASKGH